MIELPITGGVVLLDEEDLPLVGNYNWYVGNVGYARRNSTKKGGAKRRTILMHNVILPTAPGLAVDHVNGNRLDNRRSNLRPATPMQNVANRRPIVATSAYKGVGWRKDIGKWQARIRLNGELQQLGTFKDEIEAARAYNAAAYEAWGEFAWLNPLPEMVAP